MSSPPPNGRHYARKDHRTRQRRCLHCGKMFESYHAGHRICLRCANLDDFNHKRSGLPEHGTVK